MTLRPIRSFPISRVFNPDIVPVRVLIDARTFAFPLLYPGCRTAPSRSDDRPWLHPLFWCGRSRLWAFPPPLRGDPDPPRVGWTCPLSSFFVSRCTPLLLPPSGPDLHLPGTWTAHFEPGQECPPAAPSDVRHPKVCSTWVLIFRVRRRESRDLLPSSPSPTVNGDDESLLGSGRRRRRRAMDGYTENVSPPPPCPTGWAVHWSAVPASSSVLCSEHAPKSQSDPPRAGEGRWWRWGWGASVGAPPPLVSFLVYSL